MRIFDTIWKGNMWTRFGRWYLIAVGCFALVCFIYFLLNNHHYVRFE